MGRPERSFMAGFLLGLGCVALFGVAVAWLVSLL
jgi:hypothetical protein